MEVHIFVENKKGLSKSQNLNASRLTLYLSLPNPLKSGVKLRMKM